MTSSDEAVQRQFKKFLEQRDQANAAAAASAAEAEAARRERDQANATAADEGWQLFYAQAQTPMHVVLQKGLGQKRRFNGAHADVRGGGANSGGWVTVTLREDNQPALKWRSRAWTPAPVQDRVVPELYFSQGVLEFVGDTLGAFVHLLQVSKQHHARVSSAVNQAVRVCAPPRSMRAAAMARSFMPWITQCHNIERILVPYSNAHYKCMSDEDGMVILRNSPRLSSIDFQGQTNAGFAGTLELFMQSKYASSITNLVLEQGESSFTPEQWAELATRNTRLLSILADGSLTELDVSYDKWSDTSEPVAFHMQHSPALEHLSLRCVAGLHLSAPRLKSLTCKQQKGLDVRSLQCPALEVFSMRNCQHHVTYSAPTKPLWSALATCSGLQEIRVVDTLRRSGDPTVGITDETIQLFSALPALRVLILLGQAMVAPAFHMPALTELQVDTGHMGGRLQGVSIACPRLGTLALHNCIGPAASQGLVASAPHCPSIRSLAVERGRFGSVLPVLRAFSEHHIEALSMCFSTGDQGWVEPGDEEWKTAAAALWPNVTFPRLDVAFDE
jgi:hypothetical protein